MNGPMNTYYDLVYAVVRKVPRGRVTTYGIIADFLALGASRMVGWALNQCQPGDGVPAHRRVEWPASFFAAGTDATTARSGGGGSKRRLYTAVQGTFMAPG
jgi:alkylated DNA nucleotide flippase Atl1